jgi:FlaA1/EpsC-like NDP-sugar epimerase
MWAVRERTGDLVHRCAWRGAADGGWRQAAVSAGDLFAWPAAFAVASLVNGQPVMPASVPVLVVAAMLVQAAAGSATGLYRRRFRSLSFEEVGAVGVSAGAAGVATIVLQAFLDQRVQLAQIAVLATCLAVCLMFGHRYVRRMRARAVADAALRHLEPVIVLGAGEGGERAVRAMQSVRTSQYRPVALVDDDPRKRNVQIGGLRVQGTSADIARIAQKHRAEAVLLAIPSASRDDMRRLHRLATEAGLETLVMPPVQRLVGAGTPGEITRYRDEEILDRGIVQIDDTAVRELVSGSRVLVTGGGGSIGSELVRQLAALRPARLVVVYRDDSLLHGVMATIPADQTDVCVPRLVDIRDLDRLGEVFTEERPQVVFHAAALKHVPALEDAPGEAWKTNVLGTSNVISVCESLGVHHFVNISTDKAANPINVLGTTKRIAERLTAASALRTRRPYVSVRFGNVIGSRGSAIETFERQINAGGPVTVTHPEMTRYFMAVREAVLLTMQAAAIGRPGEALVLDMGTPVKIVDVARQLVEQSQQPIEIVFTGVRPGEKLHEELLGTGEAASRPFHPMIDHVPVPALDLVEGVDACAAAGALPTTAAGLQVMASHIATGPRGTSRSGERTARSGLIRKG